MRTDERILQYKRKSVLMLSLAVVVEIMIASICYYLMRYAGLERPNSGFLLIGVLLFNYCLTTDYEAKFSDRSFCVSCLSLFSTLQFLFVALTCFAF